MLTWHNPLTKVLQSIDELMKYVESQSFELPKGYKEQVFLKIIEIFEDSHQVTNTVLREVGVVPTLLADGNIHDSMVFELRQDGRKIC